MDKKIWLYIIWGMLVGGIFGASFAPVIRSGILSTLGGLLFGAFIGWFIAAAVRERTTQQQEQEKKE